MQGSYLLERCVSMRNLQRNKQTFQYRTYVGKTDVQRDGYSTGVPLIEYSEPVTRRGSISPASGYSQTEQFGALDDYDKVIITHEELPIDETSVINIENIVDTASAPYDYIVKRVAKSLNYTSVAIKKVKRQ